MTFYQVRLKRFPDQYVGKQNVSYCFYTDKEIADSDPEYREEFDSGEGFYFMVKEKYANIWTDLSKIKSLMRYNRNKDEIHTYSEYELVVLEDGKPTFLPLDDVYKLTSAKKVVK